MGNPKIRAEKLKGPSVRIRKRFRHDFKNLEKVDPTKVPEDLRMLHGRLRNPRWSAPMIRYYSDRLAR